MKKYLLSLFLGASVLLASIGSFSWYVDPFCYFERNTFGMYWHTERYCKEYYVKKFPDYELLLIGNSRVTWIDADRPNAINVAFSGANIKEIYEFLEKHLSTDRTVYIGFDFEHLYQHPERFDDKSYFKRTLFDTAHHLFSFEIVSKSFATYFYRKNFQPSIPIHVHKANREWRPSDDVKLESLQTRINNQENIIAGEEFQQQGLKQELINLKMDYFSKIKRVLEDRSTNYAIFLNPILPERIKQLEETNHRNLYFIKQFPNTLRQIFPDLIDLSIDHDFPNSKFRDVSHYTPEVGAEILKIIEQ